MSEVNVEEAEVTETEAVEKDVSRETELTVEEKAHNLGWRPEEEYSGDPERWISAKDFVERGENIMPILQANNAQLQRQFSEEKAAREATEERMKEREAYFDMETTALKARQKKELEKARDEAVQEGDVQKVTDIQAEIDEIPQDRKPEEVGAEARNKFVSENDWYQSDRMMTLFADDESRRLANEFPGLTPEQNLQRVKSAVEKQFPAHFGKPQRQTISAVESGRKPPVRKSSKDYDSMPEEYRESCDRMVTKYGIPQKTFVDNYWNENAE